MVYTASTWREGPENSGHRPIIGDRIVVGDSSLPETLAPYTGCTLEVDLVNFPVGAAPGAQPESVCVRVVNTVPGGPAIGTKATIPIKDLQAPYVTLGPSVVEAAEPRLLMMPPKRVMFNGSEVGMEDKFLVKDGPQTPMELLAFAGCTVEVVGVMFGHGVMCEVTAVPSDSAVELKAPVDIDRELLDPRFLERVR